MQVNHRRFITTAGRRSRLAPNPRIGHESSPHGMQMSDPNAPPALTGHIDQADRFSLTGWAMDPARPGEPLALELVLDGIDLGG